mmetsp:Transcript_11987/g.16259  ORF Transcript_11987/g.16259 Transcript_11987/m.16259 type:complete len:150 (+) Transcript_11987:104-553(+)|eukprot:CAMPEP_0196575016 /NCGR_PEP_ID=MMETSP1081-20130531/4586_1 /TAXON_ID=36882 /ORGANISM="Pyramimonas amylifera, Strain CCMP720" /LENGTH=149 /DNA_ID=CAMNT_0041893195 /DNA_START=97 /DNA_END=546 /DNA_ORIENTATION=+
MACMQMTTGLAGAVLPVRATRSAKRVVLSNAFTGKVARVGAVRPVRATATKTVTSMAFDSDWLKKDPLVFAMSFLGWTVPSSIPVSAYPGGGSLFGNLCSSIGDEMAHFPTGPALGDQFWYFLLTWHLGLFVVMLFGQIGVQGKKQGMW